MTVEELQNEIDKTILKGATYKFFVKAQFNKKRPVLLKCINKYKGYASFVDEMGQVQNLNNMDILHGLSGDNVYLRGYQISET